MTITAQRAEEISFSDKLWNSSLRLVAKKGSTVLPTDEVVRGKSVGVQQGTIAETYAKKHLAPKGVTVVPYQNQNLVYEDLIGGAL